MTKDPTEVAAFLARIEKLPEEWRHPMTRRLWWMLDEGGCPEDMSAAAILDLHIGHMAKRLAAGIASVYKGTDLWCIDIDDGGVLSGFLSYEDAIISAAEAIVGE